MSNKGRKSGTAKTGGRQPGTPNKRTAEVMERLAELGCDPIEGMALLAMDEENSAELRGRLYAELAQYVAPKRRAIELSSDHDREVVLVVDLTGKKDAGPQRGDD